jgi:hypothetical protein
MEELMEVGSVSKLAYRARHPELREKPSASKRVTAVAVPRLTTRASLMLALLLSLGLWVAIWALGSAILRLASF